MRKLFIFILSAMLIFSFAYAQIGKTADKYYSMYKNTTQAVPVYVDVPYDFAYSCYDGVSKNITCYKTEYEKVFSHIETVKVSSVVTGYSDGNKQITGFTNSDGNNVYRWKYDIGDRNMIEYGRCREYEKEKGVCDEYH